MKKLFLIIACVFTCSNLFTQVGVGTKTPHASSIMELSSSSKGFLPPRVSLTSRQDTSTIVSPASGLLIYNTNTAGTAPYSVSPGFYYYNGSVWIAIATGVADATIDFSINVDPNTAGTTFSPNTPNSKDYVYVSTIDGSQWTWNGTSYIVSSTPKSPFYLSTGTADAGNNKTSSIYRTGNLGIGVSTPSAPLHIEGTSYTQALFKTSGTTDRTSAIKISNNNTTPATWEISNGGVGNGIGLTDGQFYLYNQSLGQNAFSIVRSTNDIGVGTGTPGARFHIQSSNSFTNDIAILAKNTGNNNSSLQLENSISAWQFSTRATSGDFGFWVKPNGGSWSNPMSITKTGYIGIGTTSPYSQLSNTSSAIQGGGNISAINGGLTWSTPGSGFSASFYNQNSMGSGLLVKITGVTDTNYAFQVAQSPTQSGYSSTLMSVLGSGKVGIGTNNPNSRFEIAHGTAGNSGLRFTNLNSGSTTQTNNNLQLSLNATGDVILTPDAVGANKAWSTTGNASTNNSTNFLGTTDNVSLAFRTNNTEKMRLTNTGALAIGTTNPLKTFHVQAGGTSLLTSSFGDGMLYSTNNAAGCRIFLEDLNGAVDAKTSVIYNQNGILTIGGVLNDAGNSWRQLFPITVLNSNSFVGINTSAQQYNLDVNGTMRSVNNTFLATNASANVAVGSTTTPSERLTVNGAVKIGNNNYTGLTNGATTPVPAGGAGTIVFNGSNFFGWNGSLWKQLDN